jgi:hypothetical protein
MALFDWRCFPIHFLPTHTRVRPHPRREGATTLVCEVEKTNGGVTQNAGTEVHPNPRATGERCGGPIAHMGRRNPSSHPGGPPHTAWHRVAHEQGGVGHTCRNMEKNERRSATSTGTSVPPKSTISSGEPGNGFFLTCAPGLNGRVSASSFARWRPAERRHPPGRDMMSSPTLQKLQDPILPLP